MTTTENKDRYFGNVLWFVKEEQLKENTNGQSAFRLIVPSKSKVFQGSLPGGRPGIKAEGLAILQDAAFKKKETLSAVIVFDNDSYAPSALMLVELSRPTGTSDRPASDASH